MNALEFILAIKALIPKKADFRNAPDGFADLYISQLNVEKKHKTTQVNSEDVVIDLVMNYDVSKLSIGIFSFNAELMENDSFIFFGTREAFPIAISKQTKEIVEIDWADENRIISYIAKKQQRYLTLLVNIEKLNQQQMFGIIERNKYKEQIIALYRIAGGIKYKNQLEDL